jgi:hypothetical protein
MVGDGAYGFEQSHKEEYLPRVFDGGEDLVDQLDFQVISLELHLTNILND